MNPVGEIPGGRDIVVDTDRSTGLQDPQQNMLLITGTATGRLSQYKRASMTDRLIIEEVAESQRGNSLSAAGCEAIMLEEDNQSIRKEKVDYNNCDGDDGDETENRQKLSREDPGSRKVINKEPEAEIFVQNQGA